MSVTASDRSIEASIEQSVTDERTASSGKRFDDETTYGEGFEMVPGTQVADGEYVSFDDSILLFRSNILLGVVHLFTGGAIITFTDHNASIPLFTLYADQEDRGVAGAATSVIPEELEAFPVGWYAGAALIIAGLHHISIATCFRDSFEYKISQNRNPYRWFEYSLSVGLMHVMVAQLVGILSLDLLVTIFGLSFITMILSNEQEILNLHRDRNDIDDLVQWRPYAYSWIPFLMQWGLITHHFIEYALEGDPPGFVWAIVCIIFAFDIMNPMIQFLQQRGNGNWNNFVYGELWFCFVAFIAKQSLAWINYVGTATLADDPDRWNRVPGG
jgi:hypothetical protein|mmetsp:Transcript_816/g.1293  ORF Transcript_816/g.1293 Transcript_816/m.1293 type:complete len:329 (+) Transcript_816:111-1097(+)